VHEDRAEDATPGRGRSAETAVPAPPRVVASLAELLRNPRAPLTRIFSDGPSSPPLQLLAGGIVCFVAYGAAAGAFQGGTQIGWAALKAPVIVVASLALCAPSLFVFGSLAGVDLSLRRTAGLLVALSGMLGLLLAGLLPIAWLFSLSSSSLLFATWLHVAAWAVALGFGGRLLRLAFPQPAARRVALLWTALFTVVTLQMTTVMRPVLYRAPGEAVVEDGRLFFLEHFGKLGAPGTGKR
jgi:hypothetical protein